MALTNDFIDSISTRGCPKRHNQKVACAVRTSSYETLGRFTCAQRTLQLGKTCISIALKGEGAKVSAIRDRPLN